MIQTYHLSFQILGPLSVILVRHIGYRSTVVLGVGTATTAFLLTAALLHLELKMLAVFYLVTGGLWGLGMGLTTVPAMTITGQWFSKVASSYFL